MDPNDVDVVEMKAGVAPEDVAVSRADDWDGGDLRLTIRDTGDILEVRNYFTDPERRIELVRFEDGTIWDQEILDTMAAANSDPNNTNYNPTDPNYLVGTAGDDTLRGYAGDDILLGEAGDDLKRLQVGRQGGHAGLCEIEQRR